MIITKPRLLPLSEFENGNTKVTISRDGTKTRIVDGSAAMPVLPESIDLKITDYCTVGCSFCHESSSPAGKHASPDDVFSIFRQLQKGSEVAIGGGDPLAHPDIERVMADAAMMGLIPNMTVNVNALDQTGASKIVRMRPNYHLWGLGVSGTIDMAGVFAQIVPGVFDDNTVLHSIVGIDNPQAVIRASRHHKVLVLGYKSVGRGANSCPKEGIDRWRYWAASLLSNTHMPVSFDNLAIEQLVLKSLLPKDEWNSIYMGGEGEFTMFIDAVAKTYAISSTQARHPWSGKTVEEMFRHVRQMAGYERD